jgi:hypothetical protein
VTVQEVLGQYESRLHEVQAGMLQARLHYNLVGVVLAIAVAMFLMLSLYAIRQQVSFWWPSLPVPVAAASAALSTVSSLQVQDVATEELL